MVGNFHRQALEAEYVQKTENAVLDSEKAAFSVDQPMAYDVWRLGPLLVGFCQGLA